MRKGSRVNTEEDSSRIDALARLIEQAWGNDAAEELASRLTNRGGILSNQGRLKEAMADRALSPLFACLVSEGKDVL